MNCCFTVNHLLINSIYPLLLLEQNKTKKSSHSGRSYVGKPKKDGQRTLDILILLYRNLEWDSNRPTQRKALIDFYFWLKKKIKIWCKVLKSENTFLLQLWLSLFSIKKVVFINNLKMEWTQAFSKLTSDMIIMIIRRKPSSVQQAPCQGSVLCLTEYNCCLTRDTFFKTYTNKLFVSFLRKRLLSVFLWRQWLCSSVCEDRCGRLAS